MPKLASIANELHTIKISKDGRISTPYILGVYFLCGECKLAAGLV